MAQTLLITGFAGDGVTQSTMTIPQLLEAGSDTITIGSTITLTEVKPAATILLGYYESLDIGPIAAGWYRGIDGGGQPWWFKVPTSGRAIGQKDLPPTATIGTVTNRVTANVDRIADSETAATNQGAMYTAIKSGTVDDATFSPTASVFETSLTVNSDEYSKSGLLWTGGANQGFTSRVLSYAFANAKVKLTLSEALPNVPVDGDAFVIVGRIE